MMAVTVSAMPIQSLPQRRLSACQNSRHLPAPVEEIVELKTEAGDIIVPIFVPWSQPSDEAPSPDAASPRVGFLQSFGIGMTACSLSQASMSATL